MTTKQTAALMPESRAKQAVARALLDGIDATRALAHREPCTIRQTRFTTDRQLVALLRSDATKPGFVETTKGKSRQLNVHRWYVLAVELSAGPDVTVTGIVYDVLARNASDAAKLYQRMARTPLDTPEARQQIEDEIKAREAFDR